MVLEFFLNSSLVFYRTLILALAIHIFLLRWTTHAFNESFMNPLELLSHNTHLYRYEVPGIVTHQKSIPSLAKYFQKLCNAAGTCLLVVFRLKSDNMT
jgi:hypothetical protein